MVKSYWWWGGGPCDYCVTLVPIGLGFGTSLGLGLRGPDLGLGLDNQSIQRPLIIQSIKIKVIQSEPINTLSC